MPSRAPRRPCRSPQGSQVSVFLSVQGHRPVEGYPRGLQEELGVPRADAAFTCPGSAQLYLIAGGQRPRRGIGAPGVRAGAGADGGLCQRGG